MYEGPLGVLSSSTPSASLVETDEEDTAEGWSGAARNRPPATVGFHGMLIERVC